jgi:hypothetical protein
MVIATPENAKAVIEAINDILLDCGQPALSELRNPIDEAVKNVLHGSNPVVTSQKIGNRLLVTTINGRNGAISDESNGFGNCLIVGMVDGAEYSQELGECIITSILLLPLPDH